MKKICLSAILSISALLSFSQGYDQMVDSLINRVELDSLVNYVRILTGEDSVVINGTTVLIENRIYDSNDQVADYIKQTLEGYNLETFDQVYDTDGRNVYAIQEGTEYPDQYYMICAHYDAVTAFCADDNASGTAGVLEAARILSNYDFQYSIIYALWDEEEIGLIGSGYYAEQAAGNSDNILSVINMDMIAWDSNNDFLCEIHAHNYANSLDLANYMVDLNNAYMLGLFPEIQNPGIGASDHASFWYNGYSAVLLIEGYSSGDFNPYYHSVEDRISILNLPYFHKMAKLSIGSLASLSVPIPEITTSVEDLYTASGVIQLYNYPNPFSNNTTISYYLQNDTYVNLIVMNNLGQQVAILTDSYQNEGIHEIDFSRNDLNSGMYFIAVRTLSGSSISKIIIE